MAENSIVLRCFISVALATGAALGSGDAFASCGDRSRPCESDGVAVRGSYIDIYGPGDPCAYGECPIVWDDPYDESGGSDGGGAETYPIGDGPDPTTEPAEEQQCGTVDIRSVPDEYGGGSFFARVCRVGDEYAVVECSDYPAWGEAVCGQFQ